MKILFICPQIENAADANRRICLLLASTLSGQGHQVFVAGLTPQPFMRHQAGVVLLGLLDSFFTELTETYISLTDRRATVGQALWHHPRVGLATLRRRCCGTGYEQVAYRRMIEDICMEHAPDLCVAMTAPYYTAIALAQAKVAAQKGVYMLDPYCTHVELQGRWALRQEKAVMQRVAYLAMPPLLFCAYHKISAFSAHCALFREMDFPLSPQAGAVTAAPLEAQKELLYFGRFYPDFRTPAFLFQMLAALPEYFHLTLVGAANLEVPEQLSGRVRCLPTLLPEKLYTACAMADCVVNIDNAIPNQVPSKIFELFSLGKPILNISRSSCGPSLPYMQRYPRSLTVFADASTSQNAAAQLLTFSKTFSSPRIAYSEVERLFPQNTPEHLVRQLLPK